MNLHDQLLSSRCSYRVALPPEVKCLISLSTASPTNQGQRKGSGKGSDAPLPGALNAVHPALPAPTGPRNVPSSASHQPVSAFYSSLSPVPAFFCVGGPWS